MFEVVQIDLTLYLCSFVWLGSAIREVDEYCQLVFMKFIFWLLILLYFLSYEIKDYNITNSIDR